MNTIFNPDFDKTLYPKTKLNKLTDGASVAVSGTVSACRKPCASGPMFLLTLCSVEGKVTATVFHENPLYAFVEAMPSTCNAIIYGKVSLNGKYVNLAIDNIEFKAEKLIDKDELNPATSNVFKELSSYMEKIEDPFLRNVVNSVYSNEKIMKRFLMAPASECSAGAYIGGLAARTVMTCRLIQNAFMTIKYDSNFGVVNSDMLLAAALLHDVGRAYIYDISGDGKFFKNEYAILDTDTSITRDTVRMAIKDTLNIKDEEGNKLYAPKNGDVVKELIHVIDSCKYSFPGASSIAPRTEIAIIFSHMIAIADAMGMFERLMSSNIGEEKLVKAFEGGKTYFLPSL